MRGKVIAMVLTIILLGLLWAPSAETAGPGTRNSTSSGSGTDFEAYMRDSLTATPDPGPRPRGWVGPCKKCEERALADGSTPGGGISEAPYTIYDQAVPPSDVDEDGEAAEPAPAMAMATVALPVAERPGLEAPAAAPAPATPASYSINFPPAVESELVVPERTWGGGRASKRSEELALHGFEGRFTVYTDAEPKPIPLFVKYGFPTIIELRNGEHPTGGAFCGLCGPEGAFNVEAMSDRVGIMPREPSRPGEGLVFATGLTIVTDKDRSIVFDIVEVTGLTDPAGRPYQRTARCEIRPHPADTSVVDWSFEKRVAGASSLMKAEYEASLSEAKDHVVSEKAGRRLESLGDFEAEKSDGSREIELASVVTIGDETVIKFRVPNGSYGDPVALVERGGKRKSVRALLRRYTLSTPEVVDGREYLVVTMGVEPVELGDGERLAISLFDKERSVELRASAGRA